MSAPEILVIFLSVALAVFLALGIVLMVYLIVLAKKANNMADTIDQGIQNAANTIATIQKATAPAIISGLIADLINRFTEKRDKKQQEDS